MVRWLAGWLLCREREIGGGGSSESKHTQPSAFRLNIGSGRNNRFFPARNVSNSRVYLNMLLNWPHVRIYGCFLAVSESVWKTDISEVDTIWHPIA